MPDGGQGTMASRSAFALTPPSWRAAYGDAPSGHEGSRIGILALQGDFLEHTLMLQRLGVSATEVRLPRDLERVDALIVPGGESTTMARMLDLYGLREPLRARVRAGMPVWGTCAGLILLATSLSEDRPEPMGLIDIRVARNAYGRQIDSFEKDIEAPWLGPAPFRAVFIRAPVILEWGPDVEVLARLPGGTPVAARQGRVLVSAFHPELTEDSRVHALFLSMVRATARSRDDASAAGPGSLRRGGPRAGMNSGGEH